LLQVLGDDWFDRLLVDRLRVRGIELLILRVFVVAQQENDLAGFTGLVPKGPRGITEIRAVLGAFFVALGTVPLILNDPATYQMLGITYLVVALVRTASMMVDKSVVQSNIISVVVEIIFGVILVL
jgi:hypothetical protein